MGLPIYNASAFVGTAIASIISQTMSNWRLIIVDDGSSDHSVDIARSFHDDRITVLVDNQNRGLGARLNQISQMADTPFVARMDADDVMHPQRLERQAAYLTAHPEVDVVGSAVIAIDTADNPYGYRTSRPAQTAAQAAASGSFIHPTILGRREWFERFPYDEDVIRAEDYELWIRSAPHSRFEVLDEALLLYRERGLPYLRKYLRSSAGTRQVLRSYRSQPGMGIPTARLVTQSHVKDVLYRIYSLLGREDELLTRRNRPLTASEEQEARQILSTLKHTGDMP